MEAIRKAEPLIQEKVGQLYALLQEAARNQKPFDLSRGFRCLTADVVMDYLYREDFGGLSAEELKHPVLEAGDLLVKCTQAGIYFWRIFHVLDIVCDWLPFSVLGIILPKIHATKTFQKVCEVCFGLQLLNDVNSTVLVPSNRSRKGPRIAKIRSQPYLIPF